MKLRLKGAKGVLAGPELTWTGLNEIELDFTGKTGLISFAGENGCGKSSVLENLHVYPQLVSRSGALWSHFVGREAEKEFECDFMGNHYRSLIKMDSEQGKQEGFLWVNGKPVCNGKITQYKEMVNDIFGQPFTYFRSQFCPQKSKNTQGMQIENMTAGVFRELLQQFLNLQRYAQWEDTAKQAGNILAGQIAGIDQRIVNLQENVGVKELKAEEYGRLGDKAASLHDDKTILQQAIIDKRLVVDSLKATIQKNALALERKTDIQQQIDRLEGELAKEKAEAAKELDSLSIKYRAVKDQLNNATVALNDKEKIEAAAENVRDLESALPSLVAVVEEANQNIPVYQKKCHDLETSLAGLRQQQKDLDNDSALQAIQKKLGDTETAIKTKEKEIRDLDTDFQLVALQAEIKSLQKAALVGDGIDATCQSVTCAAIKSVNEAKEKLPVAQKSLVIRREEIALAKDEKDVALIALVKDRLGIKAAVGTRIGIIAADKNTLTAQVMSTTHDLFDAQKALKSTNELLAADRQSLARTRAEIAQQKALADRLPEVRIAETRKADLEKQLAEVTAAGTEKRAAWEARAKEIDDTLQYHLGARSAYVVDQEADGALLAVQEEIIKIESFKIPAIEKEIQIARDKIAALRAEIERISAQAKELVEAQADRGNLVIKMSKWRYVQLGCGKTGLQNLRIDGAAPRIIYNANRLLSQAYGARYAVRLETQNEAGKEDLQIKIIMVNGQEVYLDDVSGGQRQWLIQSLWLAMSLLNQEKSGRKYDYFCSDESDGSLDGDNAEKYTALYRPFTAEADLNRFIFISHRESCRAMADHVLCFTHGKNPSWG
jgi:exonuclease SbcC